MIRFGVVTAFEHEDASSRSLLEACRRHGTAVPVDPATLSVSVVDGRTAVCAAGEDSWTFDAFLLLRGIGRNGDADVQLEAYRTLERVGALLINGLEPLLSAQDKLRSSRILGEAGVPTPPVAVVQREADLERVLATLGRAVAKPQWGSLGEGVELLDEGPDGMRRAAGLLQEQGAVFLQAWVDHGGSDIRAFVVDGRIEAAMERIAPIGEFRTNVAVGADGRAIELSARLEEVAVRAARALGLEWAGVDLALGPDGPTVIEVNGSPGWEGIERATGRDMAGAIAAHAARRVSQRALRRAAFVEGG
ncbi:ATP-grasp domain-containing protein [Vulgatibacter incomptus]|uniref:Ribosomal protein S6 glutaminyl transferase n=1 Tax=Vulgatibacter incomptus TaxID=1391653 RepID=A0A0K1PAN5_9BACT|nr:RimK family alpha-L-glutamate ligase [Vulgatibacter incomptus]AKU90580.1 Ribosomal protein S6 glutaminyl transferase [Vulgatibacter incomptus]